MHQVVQTHPQFDAVSCSITIELSTECNASCFPRVADDLHVHVPAVVPFFHSQTENQLGMTGILAAEMLHRELEVRGHDAHCAEPADELPQP